jgi:ATP-binding cassette subfamily B protein
VAFREVGFRYRDRVVLEGVDFEVPAGTRVGIEGPTGSGKSTLVSLLMRFYDPAAGVVTLDGLDLREYRMEDLRRQFAIVLQDTALFSTTIADNIAYGRPDAGEAAIIEAARRANAHGFIERLPAGYRTVLGDRGVTLSGGERQRIALARAFLMDAPVLILDEPTSAVDVQTEALVLEALERLVAGRTSFMISHRPGTLDRCDLVLRVGDGRVQAIPRVAVAR